MTEIKWTPEQQLAITAGQGQTLLTAAAGAGKTAVLAARCVHLLADADRPCGVDELLVLTYTRAAAAQMRRRIGRALHERLRDEAGEHRLRRELVLLDQADISTIHSFCARLLRQYFYRLGIDPGFAVLEADEAELIKLQVAEDLFEDCYGGIDPALAENFEAFVQLYASGSDDRSLTQLVIRLHTFLDTLAQHEAWTGAQEQELAAVQAGKTDLKLVRRQKEALRGQLERTVERLDHALKTIEHFPELGFYTQHITEKLLPMMSDLATSLETKDVAAVIEDLGQLKAFPRAPTRPKGIEAEDIKPVKDLIDAARKEAAQMHARYAVGTDNVLAQIAHTEPFVAVLIRLHEAFKARYDGIKQQQNVLDYADLEHKVLDLLRTGAEGADVAAQLRGRYRHILVDEYQDISPVQEAILELIARPKGAKSGGNVFMVGDVKQSIYGFRQADPEIFLDKHRALTPVSEAGEGSGDNRIALNKNFRSRPEVINAINFIFSRCMTEEFAGISYGRDAQLVLGADFYDGDTNPVELHLIERAETPDDKADSDAGHVDLGEVDATEREAMVVAERIKQIVAEGGDIVDPDTQEKRAVQYRDIVVLLRSMRNRAEHWTEVFGQYNIPVHGELSAGYFVATEIQDMISLLTVLDNPQQDIPLAAVLRGPIMRLNESELSSIRLQFPDIPYHQAVTRYAREGQDCNLAERLRDFLQQLDEWRTRARRGPLADLIWQVYRDSYLLAYVRPLPDGRQRYSNLLHLYDRARQFDRFSQQGLARFLRFLEKLRAEEGDFGPGPVLTESDNVVRIMSIHRSKGLEFPVVIVGDLARRFNLTDARGPILFDRPDCYPVALPIVDGQTQDRWQGMAHQVIANAREKQALTEEMRILYVALTRARERLILTAAVDLKKTLAQWQPWCFDATVTLPEFLLHSANSPIDWLGPALAAHRDMQPLLGEADTGTDDQFGARFMARTYGADEIGRLMKSSATRQREPNNFPAGDDSGDGGAPPTELTDAAQAVISRIDWQYPHRALAHLEARTSVTDVKHRIEMDRDGEFAGPTRPGEPLAAQPGFMAEGALEPRAAEIGSWTHEFLQRVDLTEAMDGAGLARELRQMQEAGFFTEEQIQPIDVQQIARFFATALGQRMLIHKDRLQREWNFTLAVPAHEAYYNVEFADGDGNEKVLIRGIIDVLFETESGLVIVDYKTDGIEAAQAQARAQGYLAPMLMYRRAAQTILKKDVTEMYLHFLRPCTSIKVFG